MQSGNSTTVKSKTLIFCALLFSFLLYPAVNVSLGAEQSPTAANNETGNCPEENFAENIFDIYSKKVAAQIDSFYRKRVKYDHFNGSVMIAKDGRPIYSAAFGYGNLTDKDTLSIQSSIQLASITKTFTSTAILMLAEEGLLSLEDTVQKFFPEFPYQGVTVRLLLCHRSGLPDYTYWDKSYIGNNAEFLTNQTLIDLLIAKKPQVRCKPDRVFIYCNTNYAVLASIIEKVSGLTYQQYMHDRIFSPLGMSNTFVYDAENAGGLYCTISYDSRGRMWKDCPADGVVGDKGIYSSAEDMLKWDNALRTGLLLKEETLAEAYKPQSLDYYSFRKDRTRNYGYGWRLTRQPDKSYLVYHNGFWHGSNNVFARDMKDGFTVIVLGNKSNHNNYQTYPVWKALGQIKDIDATAEAQ